MPDRLTRVPLAPPEIAGVLNLRGRIVTAIDMRCRLGSPQRDAAVAMAVGIEFRGKSYGLLIDAVGEVLKLAGRRSRGQSGQSRPAARARVGRRAPARRPAPGRARRRSRAGHRAPSRWQPDAAVRPKAVSRGGMRESPAQR